MSDQTAGKQSGNHMLAVSTATMLFTAVGVLEPLLSASFAAIEVNATGGAVLVVAVIVLAIAYLLHRQ